MQQAVLFIGTSSSDYCDFIVDRTEPDVLEHLLYWLVEYRSEWDVMSLRNIPSDSSNLQVLDIFCSRHHFQADIRALYEAPAIRLGDTTVDQQLLKKKDMCCHYNQLRKREELEVHHYRDATEIVGYLDTFFEQHIRRRSLTNSPSIFLDIRQQQFYRKMVETLTEEGWLLFSFLLLNGQPIAFHYAITYARRLIRYKTTFDIAFFKQSPGLVLLKFMLAYAIDQKLAEYDFSIGKESYKYCFVNSSRVNYGTRVFHNPLQYHTTRALLNTKIIIKRSPVLTRLGQHLVLFWPMLDSFLSSVG